MNQRDYRLQWFSCCIPRTVFWIPERDVSTPPCFHSQLIMNHELQQCKFVPLEKCPISQSASPATRSNKVTGRNVPLSR